MYFARPDEQRPGQYTFEDVVKDAGDVLPFRLEFGELDTVAFFWHRNEMASVGEYVRPRTPNGFAARVKVAGRTGATEPAWATTLDAEVVDGSVTWEMKVGSLLGAATLTSPSATPTPSGVDAGTLSIEEGTSIIGQYSGGTEGSEYEIRFQFLVNGFARIARQIVRIRKQ